MWKLLNLDWIHFCVMIWLQVNGGHEVECGDWIKRMTLMYIYIWSIYILLSSTTFLEEVWPCWKQTFLIQSNILWDTFWLEVFEMEREDYVCPAKHSGGFLRPRFYYCLSYQWTEDLVQMNTFICSFLITQTNGLY